MQAIVRDVRSCLKRLGTFLRPALASGVAILLFIEPVIEAAPAVPKARSSKTPEVTVNRTVPKAAPPPSAPVFSSLPSDGELADAHLLPGPLTPVGTGNSGLSSRWENRHLAQALLAYAGGGDSENAEPLQRFLREHRGSRYEPSLLANLGEIYYGQGRVSRAFPALAQAWSITKGRTDRNGRAVADWALAGMVGMYAHLDPERRNALNQVINEAASRDVHGPATMKLEIARQERAQLADKPEDAFRCGPVALALLREYLKLPRDPRIESAKASADGFSLEALQDLANTHDMKMRAVHIDKGAKVPIPSIIHWKYDHYSAILQRKEENGKEYFRLDNPLLDNGRWLSRQALEEETSGYFLILEKDDQPGWRNVEQAEAGNVRGRCLFTQLDITQLMEWAVKAINDIFSPSCGMPHYDFHAALLSLNIADTPLGYTPPVGPPVKFRITYNQKDSFQPAVFSYSNLGPKWTFDWLSYVSTNTVSGINSPAVYLRGGGVEPLQLSNGGSIAYITAPQSHAQVIRSQNSPYTYERRLPDGSKEVFTLRTPNGSQVFMTQAVDPQGNAIKFTYDSKYRLIAVTDAIGEVTTLSYDLAGDPLKITKVTDPFGRSATLTYDNGGRLTQVTDVMGMSSTFRYGSNDFIQALNTPYGTTLFSTGHGPDNADSLNTYIEANDTLGTQRIEYRNQLSTLPLHDDWDNSLNAGTPPVPDLNTRLTFYWDRNAYQAGPGNYAMARVYQWMHSQGPGSSSGIPAYTRNALEGRVVYSYPGQAKNPYFYIGTSAVPSSILRLLEDGKTQQTTLIESNALGNVTKFADPIGRQLLFFYDSNDIDLTQVVNASTFETLATITYNSQHLPLSYTDAAGQTTTYAYNSAGQLLTVTNARGEATAMAYDSNGRMVSITGALPAAVTAFTYDSFGRIRTVTDVDGYITTYDYDAMDRVTKVSYPDQTFDQIKYDRLDASAFTDREGHTVQAAYDALRRPVSLTDSMGRTTKFGWCGCGALASVTDAKGNVTSWRRDVQGRPTAKIFADGSSIQYSYDAMTGRLVKITDAKGQITNYSYFADGNPKQVIFSGGAATAPVSFTYDSTVNRLTSFTDGVGTTSYSYVPAAALGALAAASVTGPRGEQITYSYDELGRVNSRAIDGAGVSVAYDALGRVISETNALGAFTYAYFGASDRLQAVNYPNGQSSQLSYFDVNGDLRLQEIMHLDGNQNVLSQFDYTYAAAGEVASVVRQAPELPAAPSTYAFGYDGSGQLTSATLTGGDGSALGSYAYNYDAAGNRTLEQVNSSSSPMAFDATNQVSSFKYDKNGNLTSDASRSYEWDAADRLTAIVSGTARTEFTYDGFGRRVRVTERSNGAVTSDHQLVWCGAQICEERTITSSGTSVLKRFFAQGETGSVNGTDVPYYYNRDSLGSVRQAADGSGAVIGSYEYDAWGRATKILAAKDTAFGYAGYYVHAPSGLLLTQFRAYDPGAGRWLSKDPSGEQGDLNLYRYGGNDPVNSVDPTGLLDLQDVSDFSAGFGDSLTFGATGVIRDLIAQANGWEAPVNQDGLSYAAGQYTDMGGELALLGLSGGLKALAKNASRNTVRNAAKKMTKNITRPKGFQLHHNNPLFGHPGGKPTEFPTGGLPAQIHSGPWNLSLVNTANHTAEHRLMRQQEGFYKFFVNWRALAARAGIFAGGQCLLPSGASGATPGLINWMSPDAADSPLFQ